MVLSLIPRTLFFFSILSIVNCVAEEKEAHSFATWVGLGPDKWASIWLIDRFISDGERVALVAQGERPQNATMFDVPGSIYMRTSQQSTYRTLLKGLGVSGNKPEFIDRVLHDIDINTWQADELKISVTVERGYRALQESYQRDRVPYYCYMTYFDNVAALAGQSEEYLENVRLEQLLPAKNCAGIAASIATDPGALVQQLPIEALFDLMRGGKKVVFIDVREPEEFREVRIPGAMNLPIRDANTKTPALLKHADVVVSYCVKDFRGFEMARKLKKMGVEQSVILKPFGLKGWVQRGLPVARGDDRKDEKIALEKLTACLSRDAACIASL